MSAHGPMDSGPFHTLLTEWMRKMRETWIADIEERVAPIAPRGGKVRMGSIPSGTMINRGDYAPAARYRKGDVVFSAGAFYVAIQAGSGNDVSDAAFWQLVGVGAHDIEGPLHTASGLTAGEVLTALTATTFAFRPARALIPVTNGDGLDPQIIFDSFGSVVMVEVEL